MSTYYDELGLPPQASAAELEIALDARYNQYRTFANHPDPDKRADAERNQRRVERMREVLLNPAQRAAYDAGIGLSESGGLADPAATARPTPPPPKIGAAGSAAGVADLWACPNCGTPNPEWTPFCLHCRTPLLRQCPECGQMKSLVKTGVCGNCGYEYEAATKRVALRQEILSLNNQLAARQNELGVSTKRLKTVERSQQDAGAHRVSSARYYLLFIGGFLLATLMIFLVDPGSGAFCFGVMLLLALVTAISVRTERAKDQRAEQAMAQLPHQIAALNAEVAGIQNELQRKQAALERLAH